jgi:uncharacterized membrane protein HdeD (DUF308 family)
VVMAAMAILCGGLSFCATRLWHVILTAFVGAFWTIQGVGHFFGKYLSSSWSTFTTA